MAAGISRAPTQENISSTISSGINDTTTTITIGDASKLVAPCYLVIDRVDSAGTLKSTSLWEYVKVTNIAGNDLTVTRGQGGSTNQSHSAGAIVEAVATAAMFTDWYPVLNTEHDNAGGHVIVGNMTVAGLNLLSVATVSVMHVKTWLNISGASVTGISTADPLTLGTINITSRANFASLASAPKVMRSNINSNLFLQVAIISGVSVASGAGITVTKNWDTAFSTFITGWSHIARATDQTNMLTLQTHENSNINTAGTRLENKAGAGETGATLHIYGIGTKEGAY
jgi:hypothetical protein